MKNKRYDLISTLEKMSEQVLFENLDLDLDGIDRDALRGTSTAARAAKGLGGAFEKLPQIAKFLPKAAGNLIKSTVMAIPVVDVLVGSASIAATLLDMKSLNDKMSILLDLDGESFGKYILAGNDAEYADLMSRVNRLPEDDRQILREDFESALENLKKLILTIVQSYDTVAAAVPAAGAGAASFGTGAVAVEAGTNLTTAVLGFLGSMVPIERFLLELAGESGEAGRKLSSLLKTSFKSDPDEGKLGEIKEKGGPLVYYFLSNYLNPNSNIEPGLRLYTFYKQLKREGEDSYLSQAVKGTANAMISGQGEEFLSEGYNLKRWQKLSGLS